ncbi:MAG TPA: hypothetical protein VHQ48_05410 [Bradyrhizobium sp.]|nr:hypothetical protein [Bradyrhizobium sp.]
MTTAQPDQFAATATFVVSENDPPLSVKISWVIVRKDGDWQNRHPSRLIQNAAALVACRAA